MGRHRSLAAVHTHHHSSYLDPTLDQVKRDDCSVCDTTTQDPSKATQSIVLSRAKLTTVLITCGGGRGEGGGGRGGGGGGRGEEE